LPINSDSGHKPDFPYVLEAMWVLFIAFTFHYHWSITRQGDFSVRGEIYFYVHTCHELFPFDYALIVCLQLHWWMFRHLVRFCQWRNVQLCRYPPWNLFPLTPS